MQTITAILKSSLDNAQKVGIVGVGSELRADDVAGLIAAKQIRKSFSKSKKVKIFLGHTAPENLTSLIKKFNPSHVIIIDALDMSKKPGAIGIIDPVKADDLSFSTHKLPIKLMADYLFAFNACKTVIIGIQPHSLVFGEKVCETVDKAIQRLSALLIKVINKTLV